MPLMGALLSLPQQCSKGRLHRDPQPTWVVTRQQAQALMQALILSVHERLQLGQRAEDLFASLFAKQQTAAAR